MQEDLASATNICREALAMPAMQRVAEIINANGHAPERVPRIVGEVSEAPSTHAPLARLRDAADREGFTETERSFERFVLLTAALDTLPRLPHVPVSGDVKALICDEFRFYASHPGEHAPRFDIGSASFTAMCKTATLRRFPAGQFDWEVGGIRRSDIAQVSPARLIQTVTFAALRMRGLQPVFFSHLNWRRQNRSLLETEANRSYYRMAQSMRLQPGIKGFAACSWFRSPGVHRVSPNLAWLSRVFLENGGYVVEAGPDSPEGGVLHRSRTRRALYDAGKFRPTKGLVMWPRRAMIEWAAAHPEFGETATVDHDDHDDHDDHEA
jgi:hypothetical protein